MLKKVAVVGAVGLLSAAVLSQTKLGHVAATWVDRAQHHLESTVSPDDEIRRIKEEVGNLDKDIKKALGAYAEETVDARDIAKRVKELKVQVEKSRAAVEARGKMVKDSSEGKPVKWDGRDVTYSRAKELLLAEVSAHKNLDRQLKDSETMLAVRERTRTMAEQHLEALKTQKSELETAVVELEADIKLAKIEQVESKYQNDGSRMADVKDSLARLRKRIEVQRETLAVTKRYTPSAAENRSVDEIMADLDAKVADQVGKK